MILASVFPNMIGLLILYPKDKKTDILKQLKLLNRRVKFKELFENYMIKDLPNFITTNRLELKSLDKKDSLFILELLNTEGWLNFIGDRNVNSEEEAIPYIQKIIDNQYVQYWVVQLETNSIGVISLIKRDHLEYFDIGFAFLPRFEGKGYAFESTIAVLNLIPKHLDSKHFLAITDSNNVKSIRLIEKLGFSFLKTEAKEDRVSRIYILELADKKIHEKTEEKKQ